jgi:nitrogen fixation protein NifU and related proteins
MIKVDNNIITDIKFQTFGCAAAIASSSMLTQIVIGKNLDEASEITNEMVLKELGGLPSIKIHCSNLAADALKKAIEDYKQKI